MKKIILASFIFVTATCAGLQAQTGKDGITITEQRVEKSGQQVTVSFRAEAGKRAARGGRTVVFVPTLTDGTYKWSLPAIIVQGRKARTANQRHDWISGTSALEPALEDNAIMLKNDSSVSYETTLDWQPWMNGADLVAEMLTMGCCSYAQQDGLLLYGNVSLPPAVVEPPVVEIAQEVVLPKTTGEKLADSFAFVMPVVKFEKLAPGQLFDEDRESALSIYFHQGRYDIDGRLAGNDQSLIDLMSSIRAIQNSRDSRIKAIVIAGFASPEGTFAFNDRLAFDRAVAVKKYILDHSALTDETIAIYNGSEDWKGLRMLVEGSDMYLKEQVLEIIDTVPIWYSRKQVGRLGELMRLDGGRPYKYIYENFFPLLRQAAYIKIYFENIQ